MRFTYCLKMSGLSKNWNHIVKLAALTCYVTNPRNLAVRFLGSISYWYILPWFRKDAFIKYANILPPLSNIFSWKTWGTLLFSTTTNSWIASSNLRLEYWRNSSGASSNAGIGMQEEAGRLCISMHAEIVVKYLSAAGLKNKLGGKVIPLQLGKSPVDKNRCWIQKYAHKIYL